MNILVVAATGEEIAPLQNIWFRKHKVEFLIAGVGMVSLAYRLTRHLTSNRFDFAINAGLAGSFDRNIRIGDVVRVTEDVFSELGAEDDEKFLTLKDIGLEGTDILLNMDEVNLEAFTRFKKVRGITVNTVHGNKNSIQKVIDRLHPKVESMEGAAFFYVCGNESIPCVQLRSISNYVEKRNKDSWDIPLAVQNLKLAVIDGIEGM